MTPSLNRVICRDSMLENEWDDDNAGHLGDERRGQFSHAILVGEEDEEIELLIEKEDNLMMQMKEYVKSYEEGGAEMQQCRGQAVRWMLDVNTHYGFSYLTAFLSVNYFDRFLSKHSSSRGKKWLLQLLAVGCISLAAKLEETEVPLLLDLQIGHVPHVFEPHTIQRMELLILSTLKWRMSLVTPFLYLQYVIRKVGILEGLSRALISRSEELILFTCREFKFLSYNASVVAVSCVMCACEEEVPLQAAHLKRALLSLWSVKEAIVTECVRLIEGMVRVDPVWTSTLNKVVSRSSSAPQSPMGVLEAACFSYDSTLTTACTTTSSANHLSSDTHHSNPNSFTCTAAVPPSFPPPHPPSLRKRKLSEQYSINKRPAMAIHAQHAPAI